MESSKVWERVPAEGELYSARTGHTVTCDDHYIYLFGGTDGAARKNDLYIFDPQNLVWHSVKPSGNPPAPRSGCQCAMVGANIYFFGGYTKKEGEYFNDIFQFSTTSLQWQEIRPSTNFRPEKRTDHSLVFYKDSLYAFGGYDGSHRFNDLIQFNLHELIWKVIQSETLPENRFGHTAVTSKDKMILFGGWNGHDTLNDVWLFSFTTNKWSQAVTSGFIYPRYRHCAVTLGNSMFIFGGVNKEQQRFDDIYELNINLRHWIKVEVPGISPTPRTFHRGVVFDGYFYILGGFDGQRQNDMYKMYLQDLSPEDDLESNPLAESKPSLDNELKWSEVMYTGNVYSARTGHCAINLNGNFYVFGGTDEYNRRNDLYSFDTNTNVWAQSNSQGQVPTPRSGAKGVGYNKALFLFGGYTRKDGSYYNDLHRYEVETSFWTKIFPIGEPPSPRTDHTAVLYENSIYIFAGYDGKNRYNDLHACNLDNYEWSLMPAGGSVPLTRFGHTAVVYHHNMYIFGGWDGHDTLDDLYQYAFASSIWYELRRIQGVRPNPRYRHSCVAYSGSLFIFGGVDKVQNRYNDLHEFNINTREWMLKRVTGSIPSSRTFHRALLNKDQMYILGGFDGRRQNDLYVITLACENLELSARPSSSLSRLFVEDEEMMSSSDVNELIKQNTLLKQQVKELSDRLEKEEERDLCKICYEREIDSVVLECAHRVMCTKCAKNFVNCPVCRQPIGRVVTTFSAY